ncbi:MAG: hypothetical protein A2X55_08765 [Nitrospirae bacterium GWB2_47_37]|nr:MAG: hypothetical protein A2X55_08765 [Nitrospirae bacterium GWB2_47_37]HAK87602.1 hypothetical protein [Nitrospiraceae bacterium]
MPDICETKFKEWLDEKALPHIFFEQSPETFASFFRGEKLKRPDFLIALKQIGLIAVDVKDKKLSPTYST